MVDVCLVQDAAEIDLGNKIVCTYSIHVLFTY
jgi:hypothetical protein